MKPPSDRPVGERIPPIRGDVEGLKESTKALAEADARLRESVRGIKTVPPPAPICKQCGGPRPPFLRLCDTCRAAPRSEAPSNPAVPPRRERSVALRGEKQQ